MRAFVTFCQMSSPTTRNQYLRRLVVEKGASLGTYLGEMGNGHIFQVFPIPVPEVSPKLLYILDTHANSSLVWQHR